MKPKQVVYIISDISKSLAFEWIADFLDRSKFKLKFILLNKTSETPIETELKKKGIEVEVILYHSKKDLIKSLIRMISVLKKWKPDIVHAHLFEASLIGLLASKIVGVKNRYYTRHHSSLHHEYFPGAVWYDKIINSLSTRIVSISKGVTEILIKKEKVKEDKVVLIYHGFPFDDFMNVSDKRIETIKTSYKLETSGPIIGVISRFIHWKGIQYIIPAFKEILKDYPGSILLLANAKGPYETELLTMIEDLEIPQENLRFVPFENDIAALYKCLDVFVHTPINHEIEAFGQIYIEALLSRIPSVFTKSGIANEIISDENACVVNFMDVEEIAIGIKRIIDSHSFKQKILNNISKTNLSEFSLTNYITNLENLYR